MGQRSLDDFWRHEARLHEPELAECWRCGGLAAADLTRCPHCGARWEVMEPANPFRLRRRRDGEARRAFLHVVGLYVTMIVVTLVAVAIQLLLHFQAGQTEEEVRRGTLFVLVTVEAI